MKRKLETPDAEGGTVLSVVHDDIRGPILQHDGSIVPADVCNQSNTLLGLLVTEGDVTLPVQASHFKTWLLFASTVSADACATGDAASLEANATAIEVQSSSTTRVACTPASLESDPQNTTIASSMHQCRACLHACPNITRCCPLHQPA